MGSNSEKPSLKKLYKSDHLRNLIWDILSEDFDYAFERILKELKELRSPLMSNAKIHRQFVKEMFIEYGHALDTALDLKRILDEVPQNWDEPDCEISSSKDSIKI